jgi:DNA-binding NtrC family response regulator
VRILHYNDEERELHRYLGERGHSNIVLAAAQDPFEAADRERFDAAFVGLHPHGLQLIRRIHRANRDCLVTIITADRKARPAVEAMKLGAFDYLLTPLEFAEVERNVLIMSRQYEGQQERLGLEVRLAEATRTPDGELD